MGALEYKIVTGISDAFVQHVQALSPKGLDLVPPGWSEGPDPE